MSISKNGESGCFSNILRSMLCAKSVPTHPSDHTTTETDVTKTEKKMNVEETVLQTPSNNPGIVARLMGLDSLPDTRSSLLKSPDSVPRSRSVNFMDYLLQKHEESDEKSKAQHRRIRTYVSFRENPTQKQDQLFVLFLDEDEKEMKTVNKKLRKCGKTEVKQSKEENTTRKRNSSRSKRIDEEHERRRISKMKNESRKVFTQSYENGDSSSEPRSPLKMMEQKEVSGELKLMKRKNKNKKHLTRKVDYDGNNTSTSTISSPSSVLDSNDFMPIHYKMELCTSEYNRSMDLDSAKSSSYEHRYPSLQHVDQASNTTEVKASRNRDCDELKKKRSKSDYYTELVNKLIKLTEEDMKQSNWVSITVLDSEDIQEICSEVEQKILSSLLLQLVEDLVEGF